MLEPAPPSGYYPEELSAGVTLVRRHGSDACVGRVYPATRDASDDLWTAELGALKVMIPYSSRSAALAAVCAYADRNPHISV